jgi:hypothetical protein
LHCSKTFASVYFKKFALFFADFSALQIPEREFFKIDTGVDIMSTTIITIICAVVLIVLAILALSIGLILTGKTRIRAGACRTKPGQREDCDQEASCSFCQTDYHNSSR